LDGHGEPGRTLDLPHLHTLSKEERMAHVPGFIQS